MGNIKLKWIAGFSFIAAAIFAFGEDDTNNIEMRIKSLIEQLGNDDPEARDVAQKALSEIAEAGMQYIEKEFETPNPEIRQRVRAVLREKDSIIFLCRDMLSDEIPGNAERARKLILKQYKNERQRFIPYLVSLVKGEDSQAAFYAAYILISKQDDYEIDRAYPDFWKWSIRKFCRSLPSDISWIATRVVIHFCCTKDPEEVDREFEQSLAGLRRSSYVYRELSYYIMTELFKKYPGMEDRSYESNASMAAYMKENKIYFPSPLLRGIVEESSDWYVVRRLGDFCRPVLVQGLRGASRDSAAEYLVRMGADAHTPGLLEIAAENPSRFRDFLAKAGKTALNPLKESLNSESPVKKIAAACIIVKIDPSFETEMVTEVLVCALKSDDAAACYEALKKIGAPAKRPLEKALESEDPQTVLLAVKALNEFGALPETLPRNAEKRMLEMIETSGEFLEDPHPQWIVDAVRALGCRGEPILKEITANRKNYNEALVRAILDKTSAAHK